MQKSIKRQFLMLVLCIIVTMLFLFGHADVVHADGSTEIVSDGTVTNLITTGTEGSGDPSTGEKAHSLYCIAFSLWETRSDNKYELKGVVLQCCNSKGSWYYNYDFQQAQRGNYSGGMDPSSYIGQYFTSICDPSTTVVPSGTIPFEIVGSTTFLTLPSDGGTWGGAASTGAYLKGGQIQPYFDSNKYHNDSMHYARQGSDYEVLHARVNDGQFVANIMEELRQVSGTNLADASWTTCKLGISEVLIWCNRVGGDVKLGGWAFPCDYNLMFVEENASGLLFPYGQKACFTYTGSDVEIPRDDVIHTYDVDHNPSVPDKSEQPDSTGLQTGTCVINKVYIDLTGSASADYKTTATTSRIVVSDERGKISDDWSFVCWCPSAIGASGYSKTNYSGFDSNPNRSGTLGLVDIHNIGGASYEQINLLFVKSVSLGAGEVYISEQSLGVGTTQVMPLFYLSGKDEAGLEHYVDDDDCDASGGSVTAGTDWSCSDKVWGYRGTTATRTVTYNWQPFFSVFALEHAENDKGYTGTVLQSATGSTSVSLGAPATWTITGTNTNSATGGHPNHDPSRPAFQVIDQNLTLNTEGFAIYRHAGLGDDIVPLYSNSTYNWEINVHNGLLGLAYVGTGSCKITSDAYTNALGTSLHRATAGYTASSGAKWEALATTPSGYGSQVYYVNIPKDTSVCSTTFTESSSTTEHGNQATLVSASDSSTTLLDKIVVFSYRATPDITPAEYGDRLEYDLDVTPMVVMYLPYAQTVDGKPVESSTTLYGNDEFYSSKYHGTTLVAGEYKRTLHLSSYYSATPAQQYGLAVQANTILNDTRVSQYLLDDLGWQSSMMPTPIPGGSIIMVGQNATTVDGTNTHNRYGGIGEIKISIGMPYIGNSPLRYQLDDNLSSYFSAGAPAAHTAVQTALQAQDAQDWIKRYYGQSASDESYYESSNQSICDYMDECMDELSHVYLALYVFDTVDMDSYEIEDGLLFKTHDNTLTPTGIIAANGEFDDLNGGEVRVAHDDEKYSFGGINGRAYLRIVRDYYPLTSISLVGVDTTGTAYAIGGPYRAWDSMLDPSEHYLLAVNPEYFYHLWESLGCPVDYASYKVGIRDIDYETANGKKIAEAAYEAACGVSFAYITNGQIHNDIMRSYMGQIPFHQCNDTYMFTYKDGQYTVKPNSQLASYDLTTNDRMLQLLNSVEHDGGNDTTYYSEGDWYNEGILPYYSVWTDSYIRLYCPSDASTVIDPSLMGYSKSNDDKLDNTDIAWNGALVGLAFDGMTQSEFEDNIRFTLPDWGSADTTVELLTFGTSDPLAISNTDVSDIY